LNHFINSGLVTHITSASNARDISQWCLKSNRYQINTLGLHAIHRHRYQHVIRTYYDTHTQTHTNTHTQTHTKTYTYTNTHTHTYI